MSHYHHSHPRANPKAERQAAIAHSQNSAAARTKPRDPSKSWTGPTTASTGPTYTFEEQTIKIPANSFDISVLASYLKKTKAPLKIERSSGEIISIEATAQTAAKTTPFNKHDYAHELSTKVKDSLIVVAAGETIPDGLSSNNRSIWETKRYKQVPLTTALHAAPELKPTLILETPPRKAKAAEAYKPTIPSGPRPVIGDEGGYGRPPSRSTPRGPARHPGWRR